MAPKRTLHLAPELKLKPEQMLQRFAILAMSGAGKSNTAVVMAEEAYDCGIPWVAIDPKGDWWGVRAGADGKKQGGLSVPVLGGLHGDIPLEETAGKLVAELVASERLTCVLDVSEFESKAAQLRFLTDFAIALLKTNRDPLMLFCEEAEDYLPQRVMKSEARCAGAWHRLVKRGRFRGVFPVIISQRTQEISKAAISQVDTLLPMRTTWQADRKKIVEWVAEKGVAEEAVDELPNLEDGEAMVWSPQKLKINTRVRFRRRRTFDSGDTPTLRGRPVAAKVADVDLDAVKDAMAATVERVKNEDPTQLQKQVASLKRDVARLEKELDERPTEPVEVEKEVDVEVPVVPDGLNDKLEEISRLASDASSAAGSVSVAAGAARDLVKGVRSESSLKKPAPKKEVSDAPTQVRQPGGRASGAAKRPPAPSTNGNVDLKPGARRMLVALAQMHPERLSRGQLGTLADVKPGGTFSGYLSNLRTAGLIEDEDKNVALTAAGVSEAGDAVGTGPPPPEELLEMWCSKVKPGAERMLRHLFEIHPESVSRGELGEAAQINAGGTFSGYLSNLRVAGLLDESGGGIAASPTLFIGERS